jgi:hypothetical protein
VFDFGVFDWILGSLFWLKCVVFDFWSFLLDVECRFLFKMKGCWSFLEYVECIMIDIEVPKDQFFWVAL